MPLVTILKRLIEQFYRWYAPSAIDHIAITLNAMAKNASCSKNSKTNN